MIRNIPKRGNSAKPVIAIGKVQTVDHHNPGRDYPFWWLLLFLSAWILSAGLPSATDHGVALGRLPTTLWPWIVLTVFTMILAYRTTAPLQYEKPRCRFVGLVLAIIVIVAIWMRAQRIFVPIGPYWDDTMVNIYNPRNLMDFGEGGTMFPFGIPAFPPYWTAFLWGFYPETTGYVIQRISPIVTDAIGVWLMYLAGKEYGGIQVGLWSSALAAISKPLVLSCLSGQGAQFMFPAMALFLLFTAKLLKRPVVSRYFFWGLAVAFGIYTYNAYRPLVLLALLWTFLALVVRSSRKPASFEAWLFAAGSLSYLVFEFFRRHRFMEAQPKVAPGIAGIFWVVMTFLLMKTVWESRRQPGSADILRWIMGASVLTVAILPIVIHPEFGNHVRAASFFSKDNAFVGFERTIQALIAKTWITIQCVYSHGPDRLDMNLPQRPFFEYPLTGLFCVGVALVLIRPTWIKMTLLMVVIVGLTPHILSKDPYSSKLAALPAPFILIASLAIARVDDALLVKGMRWSRIFRLLAIAGISFVGWGNYRIVYEQWFQQMTPDSIVNREIRKSRTDELVYLASYHPGFFTGAQSALLDNEDARLLQASNAVDSLPEGNIHDLLVAVSGHDRTVLSRLSREFPSASVREVLYENPQPNSPPFMVLYRIPGHDIEAVPDSIFHRAPQHAWVRRIYGGHYGLCRGIVMNVDHLRSLEEASPPGHDTATIRYDARIRLDRDGQYLFRVKTLNYAILEIGDRGILDLRPRSGTIGEETQSVRLKAGIHPVVLKTYFQRGTEVPLIEFRLKGEQSWRSLSDAAVTPE